MARIIFEEMPRASFPKDLQRYPDLLASELYNYRVVSRGPARVFNVEFENSLRTERGQKKVAFHLHDVALFFAKAAAEGVIGNLAYAVLVKAVSSLRKPSKEFPRTKLRFEAVVSKRSYSLERRKHHPQETPARVLSPKFSDKLETQYRLMVKLTRTLSKKTAPKKKSPADRLR